MVNQLHQLLQQIDFIRSNLNQGYVGIEQTILAFIFTTYIWRVWGWMWEERDRNEAAEIMEEAKVAEA